MEKCGAKIYTPIKLLDSSTMTHEESEDIHNWVSNLENQIKELNDRLHKHICLANSKEE